MKPVKVSQKPLNTMRIEYCIEQAAKHWPNKIAVLDPELSITYSQLVNKIQQLKSKLEQNGVCPTNTVGVRIKKRSRTNYCNTGGCFSGLCGAAY